MGVEVRKPRRRTAKEIYEEVCNDILVDAAFERLIYALIDERNETTLELFTAMLRGQLLSSVNKAKEHEIECEDTYFEEHA